ncbi:histidine ammonia-lyase [Nematostella vectensis]|uniref:histidine ammonia-lyase n=1 Tax=Nematostella vectensis TaxID=45351 RepID=UPI00207770DD|nr:histidine ammonia-lyase [Nematostella vectensis]
MRVNVRIEGEWIVVPCEEDNNNSIQSLVDKCLLRRKSISKPFDSNSESFEVRLAESTGLLSPTDIVRDVLKDNDFIWLEKNNTSQSQREINGLEKNHVPLEPECKFVALDGETLSTDVLVKLGKGGLKIKLTEESEKRINKARALLDEIVRENRVSYGVTTGFGKFAQVVISKDKLQDLQQNLVRSHAVGVGNPLTLERTRMLLALRINVLAKGYSGISLETLQQYIEAYNKSLLPRVPEQGTVGASGDLAPLAHLALGIMLGEGQMWSPKSGWADAKLVLEAHDMKPVELGPKEGIALINGTQLITALGAEALERSFAIARQANIIAAMSVEVLKGSSRAFDFDVHRVRPHKGQGKVAETLRAVLHSDIHPSEIAESHRFCNRVQDAYTLRCCPQVHGIVFDTIEFVRGILTTEINSATDNPIVFVDREEIISGGNFHGEYPAKALDYLAIGVHELASMSERRLERLMNPAYSELPAFLVKNGGLNSGFMMAHCTSAALVSENKVLCHPSSVDSLSTSAGQEDHVSMGGFSARKALLVVENVERALAIELLAACQGIEFLRPLKTTEPLEALHKLVRSRVEPLETDRFMAPDIDAVTQLLREEKAWEVVAPFVRDYRIKQTNGQMEDGRYSPTSSTLA